MANAFVIEHRDLTAGIAVRERGGFPFFSSDALFLTIETQRFRRLRQIELAVKRVVHAASARPAASARTGTHHPPLR
jgi:hypothetical protein